ncbi:hypothetical protein D3C85_382280 [compost metagenome]
MNPFLAQLFGAPSVKLYAVAFPGLELTDSEKAAIRHMQTLLILVRLIQVACLAYGAWHLWANKSFMGLLIGLAGMALIGTARPTMPASISAKIAAYLAAEEKEGR